MTNYKSKRIVDGKLQWVIIDENGNIENRNPSKDELEDLGREQCHSRHRFTKNKLLSILKQFQEENKRVPIVADFDSNSRYPSSGTYQRHFGSWDNALEMADILDKRKRQLYTDQELLNYLIQFYKENDKIPTKTDLENYHTYPSHHAYRKHFGNWSNALRLVGFDVDTMVKKGIVKTYQQKARLAEIIVKDHFKENPVDLAGKNQNSSCDGICPNGKSYDVKSSALHIGGILSFGTANKHREDIEIYYFLGFNEYYTKLIHAWRVPSELVKGSMFHVGLTSQSHRKFTIENMREYEITEKLKEMIKI